MATVMTVNEGGQVSPGHGREILWFIHGRPRFDSLLLTLYDNGVYVFPAFINGFLLPPLDGNPRAASRAIRNDQVVISYRGIVLSLILIGNERLVVPLRA